MSFYLLTTPHPDRPVVSAENRLTDENCVACSRRRILSNITGCTGPIFAIFSPYECALHIAYFPICQGTLPWQPNNVAVMKAN